MLSVDELAVVPLFSKVSAGALAAVAQTAADLRLAVGEYAVHEGDDRALFAVLSGKIAVTKVIDGIVRTIGARAPGQIFGEIPIIFGIPFQGSFHASEPARVIRIEAARR